MFRLKYHDVVRLSLLLCSMLCIGTYGTRTALAQSDGTTPEPPGSTLLTTTNSNVNPNGWDKKKIMDAIRFPHKDLVVLAAHRGIHALAGLSQAPGVPENSLQSILLAAQAGWEVVEVDVQLTSDGVPILTHDRTWGREWCSYAASVTSIASYNPFLNPTTPFNEARNPAVAKTSLSGTRWFYFDNTTLRDSVSLTQGNNGFYTNGCSNTGHSVTTGEFPPTLQEVLNYIRSNKLQIVLALDVQAADRAKAAWNIVNNAKDDQGNSFADSTIFKLPAAIISTPDKWNAIFGTGNGAVNFIPVITTSAIAPASAPETADTEDGGFDVANASNPGFGSEANIISWLTTMEKVYSGQIPAVEVVVKENGGILSKLLTAAKSNLITGAPASVGNFNPIGEYYPNGTSEEPQFFRSSNGSCCDYLEQYLYNNPNHTGPVDKSQPVDNADNRRDLGFIIGTGSQFVTTDDPATLEKALKAQPGAGLRNICYMQAAGCGALGQSGGGGGASNGGGGGALGQSGTGSQYVAQSIGVPAYFYPTPGASPNYWAQMTQTTPKVGFVVANVSNGPNFGVDTNYSTVIAATHNAGTKVLGYVDTGYFGGTSPARTTRLNQTDVQSWTTQIEQDVDAWYSLYGSSGIDGIFFDDGQNVCGTNNQYVTLYTDILNYVKQNHPGAYVVTNPGTAVPQCLENIADTLLTFEGSFDCYTNDSNCPAGQGYTALTWTATDPKKIYHIVYAVPSASLASISTLTKQNNAGFVFITDATLAGNPYGSLPSYLTTEAADTAPAISDTTVPTPPSTLSATSVSGTSAVLTWNSSTDTNGSGVVGYDVYQNGVKVISVPASSSPQVTVTGLLPSTNYSFTVAARNAAGTASAASNTLTFTTNANNGGVTAPSITSAVANNNDATLNWNAAQAGSYPLAYYDVYLNGTRVITVDAGITSADVIALTSNTSYTFTVQARDTEGDVSPMSNTVTLKTTSPSTPPPCTVAKTGASVSISCTYTSPWAFHHVYIDADSKSTTGFQFAWTTPAMGADYLIENTNFNSYTGNGTSFSWSTVASIQPVVTGSDAAGFVYTWTIPLSDFSGVPLGTPALYLMNGTGYAPEGYGTVLSK